MSPQYPSYKIAGLQSNITIKLMPDNYLVYVAHPISLDTAINYEFN